MGRKKYITLVVVFCCVTGFAQVNNSRSLLTIEGSVKGKETLAPISGVSVSTDKGEYTTTNRLGEFRIQAALGDILIVESPDFETVRHRIKSNEDIDVLVMGYAPDTRSTRSKKAILGNAMNHQRFLDSANFYKRTDLQKSIDFIAKSISNLGKRGNKAELSKSLTALGEIYTYHRQYDLAIANLKDALSASSSSRTILLLGKAYNANGEFKNAETELLPLMDVRDLVPYQRVELYEALGDSYKGQGDFNKAVDFYQEGLTIAQKNQISPKIIDLNSKIGESFSQQNRILEAEGFFNNSLSLSKEVAPERVVKENEKVADFYNDERRYDEEIRLRKQSLNELAQLPKPVPSTKAEVLDDQDSITSQRINYKIANAYIAQDKLDEAIPYLQRSIVEADSENDLVVQKDATRKLSEVYRYKGDFSKALESYQEYVAVVDSLYILKEQEISRAARFNREIATKQNRISSLEQERQLSQSKYDLAVTEQQLFEENSKRQKWIIYTLLMAMVLLGSTAYFFYRSNKQQKLANNLLALKSLRTQMNPHFIFNALNSVNNYIAKSDERSANRFLSEFSVLMRSVLENSEEDFIPLSKEMELLELYVKLEHSRFADKFDYEINVDQTIDVEAFQIPPMLLQPYIENAIWHGLRYKEEKGYLHIDVNPMDNETLQITITDNGIGRKKSAQLKTQNQKKQRSKGMGNIKKRIQILNDMYKNRVAVVISDLNHDQTGTKVSLQLKKK
ncbi:tetratricopeptide repeat-containing sensor histidine kinase [Flagellimonas allohymeniacidonis]|uniref:Tetratricopeptide repeat protein n=1 Tax=Flagellimonas allohymeniacidonis TaxID=2517819 RepID=A0A4Q8QBJ4_9FLAO|nr:histidine kinase [Allomuricauda hymeniacidonis]TAI47014.1 tetratricopeptide repeat protein [Allomuricauda hymeniacidonis]